jgi:hypothetical protein
MEKEELLGNSKHLALGTPHHKKEDALHQLPVK